MLRDLRRRAPRRSSLVGTPPIAPTEMARDSTYTHSVRALVISSPARYERAARVARSAGFEPELLPGHFGHASRCLPEKYIDKNTSRPWAVSHIWNKNTIMNIMENMRDVARIIVQRNVSHAFLEDDIVLATSAEAVQRYLAERAHSHSWINLGGCYTKGCTSHTKPECFHGGTFTCGHAYYFDPVLAREILQRTENCKNLGAILDGNFRSRFCHDVGFREATGVRPCADWQSLLQFYQGAGRLPPVVDTRCDHCPHGVRGRAKTSAAAPASSWFSVDSMEKRCRTCASLANRTSKENTWFPDPYGWVGFGHFLQDRVSVPGHLHNANNGLVPYSKAMQMVRSGERSVRGGTV